MSSSEFFFSSDPTARQLSLHPAHLVDKEGRLTPGALIPFCGYSGNMEDMGQRIKGLDYPACNKFEPTILDGEVCYALDIKTALPSAKGKTQPGKGKSIFLAINMETALAGQTMKSEVEYTNTSTFETGEVIREGSVTINLGTLLRFTDSRPGLYEMTSLKQMTGTSSFLGLSDDQKRCQIEMQQSCYNRKYVENVQHHCGCTPWHLTGNLQEKQRVILKIHGFNFLLLFFR